MSLDDLIVYEADGASIPEIVEERGWSGFRDIEYLVRSLFLLVPPTAQPSIWMVEQLVPTSRGACSTFTCVCVSACIQAAAAATLGEHAHGARTRVTLQVTKKAASLPAFALIDAGGGVLVDLDADGNEIYSQRKVHIHSSNQCSLSTPAHTTRAAQCNVCT